MVNLQPNRRSNFTNCSTRSSALVNLTFFIVARQSLFAEPRALWFEYRNSGLLAIIMRSSSGRLLRPVLLRDILKVWVKINAKLLKILSGKGEGMVLTDGLKTPCSLRQRLVQQKTS